jgi:NAD(P)-dependent dehydrogenase (short-subunit alcohol dehydrogenase family)
MDITSDKVFIVTGGASGLGEGTVRMLANQGAKVVIADLQVEKGQALAAEVGGVFVKCDVSQEADAQAAVAAATATGKLMGLVNCAGIAPAIKTVGKDGAHPLANFSKTIYSASKGGVVGMTLPIARDLARNGIRNMTIAPGIFGTPMLFGMPQEVQDALAASVPFPSRLGTPQDYAKLVKHIIENDMLNGEVIRLDGAIRMAPK